MHVPQLTVLSTPIPARLLCRDGVCSPFGLLTLDAFSLRKVVVEAETRGQEERGPLCWPRYSDSHHTLL